MQCAELHGHFPPCELARKIGRAGGVYQRALIAVERNNHGYGVLAHLQAVGVRECFREGGQDGWLTSAVSRPAMIENLAAVLVDGADAVSQSAAAERVQTFVRHADGHSAAARGAHDDCVMAMAIALAVRREGVGTTYRGGSKLEVGSLPGRNECSTVTDMGYSDDSSQGASRIDTAGRSSRQWPARLHWRVQAGRAVDIGW